MNYEPIAYALVDHIVAPPTAWSGPRTLIGEPAYYPERPAHRDPDDEAAVHDAAALDRRRGQR